MPKRSTHGYSKCLEISGTIIDRDIIDLISEAEIFLIVLFNTIMTWESNDFRECSTSVVRIIMSYP